VPHAEQELLIISENLSIPLLPYLSWKELHVYLNTINTTGATCGAGTAYHFGGIRRVYPVKIYMTVLSMKDRGAGVYSGSPK
jgi:hypothetical protein